MKNQTTQEILNSANSPFGIEQNDKIKCKEGQISEHACLNKNCAKYAFICKEKTCECRKDHSSCLMVLTSTILKGLKGKIVSLRAIEQCITEKFDKLIDTLSDFRDKTLLDLKKTGQYCGLRQNQIDFATKFNNGQTSQITGEKLWDIHLDFQPNKNLINHRQQSINLIEKKFEKILTLTKSSFSYLDQIVNTFSQQRSQLNRISTIQLQSSIQLCKSIFSSSKIITKEQEFGTLTEFFYPKIIRNVSLLYRASENGFQVNKFHEKCDLVANTLTLCESQFDRKFGGYTPLKWSNPSSYEYKADDSSQSFMFSLTNKDKFNLIKKTHSIRVDVLYGPTFGHGNDLIIHNKANQSSSSSASINTSYQNDKYQKGDTSSWLKFCGNSNSANFKLKEWEVWKIQFQ